MTGYARAEGRCAIPGLTVPFNWVWEAKSVNSKGLDIRIRVPTGFDSLELAVRQAAAPSSPGSLTVGLQATFDSASTAPKLNEPLLDAAIALAMKKAAALPPGRWARFSLRRGWTGFWLCAVFSIVLRRPRSMPLSSWSGTRVCWPVRALRSIG